MARGSRLQGSCWGLMLTSVLLGATAAPGWGQTAQQGYELLERGWVDDAIATFSAVVSRSPDSVAARLGLAMAYQRAGRDSDAWAAYQQVLRLEPDSVAALSAVGELGAYRAEWQPGGIAALTELLELQPTNTTARAQRALLYGYQGQFAAALADYEPLLAANPSPATLLGAAQIYAFSGSYDQAVALFERYAARQPIPASAAAAYALALRESGEAAAAVALLAPLLPAADALDPVAVQLRTALANATDASGDTARALALLEPLDGEPAARLELARTLSAIGRRQLRPELFAEAVALYQQVLADTEPSYGLRVEAADVFSEWPDSQPQALAMFQALAAENPAVSLQVRSQLLSVELGQQDPAAAAAALLEQVQPLPADAVEQRAIVQALTRLDRPSPALLPVYEAVAAQVETPSLLPLRIAQMQLELGNLAAARAGLERYRAAHPADAGAALLIADIQRREGDLEASARSYEALVAADIAATDRAEALRGLSFVRTLQGQPRAALPAYEAAIAAEPDNPVYPLGYALLAYRSEAMDLAAAEAALQRWLVTYDPSAAPPELYELAGTLPAALEREGLYQQLLTQRPEDAWLRWRAIEVLATRDLAAAEAELADLIVEQPENPDVYYFQGELAQRQGDLELAAVAYEQLLALDAAQIGALSALAGVRFQQGELAAARELYGQVLELEPENVGARVAIAELNIAEDYRLTGLSQLRQLQAESAETARERRIQDVEFDLLRRRGFQPPWERY